MTLLATLQSTTLLLAIPPGFWHKYTADMAHRHVLLAYAFAWAIQLAYLFFVLTRSRTRAKLNQLQ